MADSRTTKQNYQDIANAIRSVNGESIQYTPVEMAPKIRSIQKKNGDQIIDHFDLTLIHSANISFKYNGDEETPTKETETFVIEENSIQNKFNYFLVYLNLEPKVGDGFQDLSFTTSYVFYQKNDVTNSKWLYDGTNLNESFIGNTIVFTFGIDVINYVNRSIDISPTITSNPDMDYYRVSFILNNITVTDDYITKFELNKTVIEYGTVELDFVSPVAKLTLYGATPIYK